MNNQMYKYHTFCSLYSAIQDMQIGRCTFFNNNKTSLSYWHYPFWSSEVLYMMIKDDKIFGRGDATEGVIERHSGLILGLRPANERRRYKVTSSLIDWAQT